MSHLQRHATFYLLVAFGLIGVFALATLDWSRPSPETRAIIQRADGVWRRVEQLWPNPLFAAQPPEPKKSDAKEFDKKDFMKKGFHFGPGSMGQERKLVKQFDKDGDGRLNNEERKAAREFVKKEGPMGGRKGFGPGGFSPGGLLVKPLLDVVDADRDGAITKDELRAALKKLPLDDGKSLDEKKLAERVNEHLPPPPGFPAPPGGIKFGPGTPLAGGIVKRADADKNGKVTMEELVAAADLFFTEADKNKDQKVEISELPAAIALVMPAPTFGPPGFGPFGKMGGREPREPAKPGPRVTPTEVRHHSAAPLYEPTVLRTLFLEFENPDWEAELGDFIRSDVDVPATLTVDGKAYPGVGVHFRGMSSLMGVPAGHKRSLNLSLDFADPKQRLYGHKTLNLLNGHGDPSFMSTVLYSHIARQLIPAPKANFVKVVINGESWGIYASAQQFNKDFLAENYPSAKGARWHVKGSPGGDSGLHYVGDSIDEYKRRYQIKSDDNEKSWKALINLCKVLSETPLDQLEAKLQPILDIEGTLKFLALDVALSNSDGYWTRASDYNLYLDKSGVFHLIPHDMNEAFTPGHGPGFGPPGKRPFGKDPKDEKRTIEGKGPEGKGPEGKGPEGKGPEGKEASSRFGPEPLVGMNDTRKPLRSRLLAVPSLRAKYLDYVRLIASDHLDWKKLGPVVVQYRELIGKEMEIDTRKLSSLAAFQSATADTAPRDMEVRGPMNIRAFADGRRNYLLNHPAIKK